MAITQEVVDELLKGYTRPEDLTGPDGILKQLTKALLERAMEAELTHQLGYSKNGNAASTTSNRRNGKSKKTLRSEHGPIDVQIPRDRDGLYEPQIIPKHSREFKGFDDKILSMYSHGMTVREISSHLKDIYGMDVSPDLISRVTDSVKELLEEWRRRPLEAFYPVVFLDALQVNVREDAKVVKKAVYLALAIKKDGTKEVLGLWMDQAEGSKFWLGILNELQNRGVRDILIAAVDGLTGFPEAIKAVFPKTEVQLCIVHMVRNSLSYVSWKDRKKVAADLRKVYTSPSEDSAMAALEGFERIWGGTYPMVARSWRVRWNDVITFLKFPEFIRKIVYTTNAIESVNFTIRKVIKTRQSFPNSEAALKLIYLALENLAKKWTMPLRDWGATINQFSILYEDRVPL